MPYHILGYTTGTGALTGPGPDISSPVGSNSISIGVDPDDFYFAEGVNTSFSLSNQVDQIRRHTIPDISDIGTASANGTFPIQDFQARSFTFKPDGTRMFATGWQTNIVRQYDLTAPWDLSILSATSGIDLDTRNISPVSSIRFNADGTRLFATGAHAFISGRFDVIQMDLTTPYDVTSGVGTETAFEITAQTTGVFTDRVGLAFAGGGTKMYTTSANNRQVYQYTLSTPYDVSTASYDSVSFSTIIQGGLPYCVSFNAAEDRMYLVNGDSIRQYIL